MSIPELLFICGMIPGPMIRWPNGEIKPSRATNGMNETKPHSSAIREDPPVCTTKRQREKCAEALGEFLLFKYLYLHHPNLGDDDDDDMAAVEGYGAAFLNHTFSPLPFPSLPVVLLVPPAPRRRRCRGGRRPTDTGICE